MIIHFDYTINQVETLEPALLQEVVAELMRSHRYGHHLVVINRPVASWLLENLDLSDKDKASLAQIERDYTQTADLVRRCQICIRLREVQEPYVVRCSKFVDIDIRLISKPYILDRVVLVFEDATTDGKLYSILFELLRSKIGAPAISWEPTHGGGSRTIEIAEEKAKEKRIVCALIDTDLKSPSSNKNSKISQIERISDDLGWPLVLATTPSCREIENMIPYEIVKLLPCAASNKSMSDIETILKYDDNTNCDLLYRFWMYFDVKDGLDGGEVEEWKNGDAVEWIKMKMSAVTANTSNLKLQGFGSNVVGQLVANGSIHGQLRRAVHSNKWWSYFGDYFSFLMWVCSSSRKNFT